MSEKEINLVRSLYGDLTRDEENNYLFDDATIEGWLELAEGNAYRAAAMACRALSVDQAYLLKVVRTDDLQVNGAAVAAELRLMALDFEKQAENAEPEAFEVFEIPNASWTKF